MWEISASIWLYDKKFHDARSPERQIRLTMQSFAAFVFQALISCSESWS